MTNHKNMQEVTPRKGVLKTVPVLRVPLNTYVPHFYHSWILDTRTWPGQTFRISLLTNGAEYAGVNVPIALAMTAAQYNTVVQPFMIAGTYGYFLCSYVTEVLYKFEIWIDYTWVVSGGIDKIEHRNSSLGVSLYQANINFGLTSSWPVVGYFEPGTSFYIENSRPYLCMGFFKRTTGQFFRVGSDIGTNRRVPNTGLLLPHDNHDALVGGLEEHAGSTMVEIDNQNFHVGECHMDTLNVEIYAAVTHALIREYADEY